MSGTRAKATPLLATLQLAVAIALPAQSAWVTTGQPSISGTAEANSSVKLYVDNVLIETTAAVTGKLEIASTAMRGRPSNLTEVELA